MVEIETQDVTARLLQAALPHVAFDGWSDTTFLAACEDAVVVPELARLACPRGGVDLAVRFHHDGDDALRKALTKTDVTSMKIREKITYAVRLRIDAIDDKEAARRAATEQGSWHATHEKARCWRCSTPHARRGSGAD